MELLLIMLLGGAVIWLWDRVGKLEYRLGIVEQSEPGESSKHATQVPPVQPAQPAQPIEETPKSASASVPLTRKPSPAEILAREVKAADLPPVAERPAMVSAQEETAPFTEEEESEHRPRFQFDFEDIFGRRLPIWAGGITLAIAGVFLVRYSIESGLLTPAVRVALAFLFGLLLLGSAEWAHRNEGKVADERVRQSLAGAGLATLYAAFYLAGTQYGLIGQTFAFLGLAVVTAGAIGLSFRFGLPCAVLGLVGGFAAPALVGGEEANLPLLSLYLGLITAGLIVTGKQQSRPWLSIAALVFGLGWGALLLLSGDPGIAEIIAMGLYFIVLGAILPGLTGVANMERPVRLSSAFVASVQLALLVDQGGYAPLTWALYLLLGATLAFFAWRKPMLREASAITAAVILLLLAQWDGASGLTFAAVAASIAVIYAGIPLIHAWRRTSTRVDLYQLAGVPLALGIIAYANFGIAGADVAEPVMAIALLTLSILPLAGAWRIWHGEQANELALLLAIGGLLIFASMLLMTPAWTAVAMATLIFAGLFALLRKRGELSLRSVYWGFALLSLAALFASTQSGEELELLFGFGGDTNLVQASIRWFFALVPWTALALHTQDRTARIFAEVLAALFAYGFIAQFAPSSTLTWVAAAGAIAIWRLQSDRVAAQATLIAIAGLWALIPIGEWAFGGYAAIAGEHFFHRDLPSLFDLLDRALPFAIALGLVGFPTRGKFDARLLAAPIGLIIAHTLFKQIFAIDTETDFITFGMAERTLWEALLLGIAILLTRDLPILGQRRSFAKAFAGLALAHALWFSGLVHNPLWTVQEVGPTPMANLVLASGAIAIGAVLLLRRGATPIQRIFVDGAVMTISSFTALALLRQTFAGSVLVDLPVTQAEDLLRSLLGIVLALGFLFIGQIRAERSWRIGSLVLMLIAVAKVFLFDAAGLEGLLRIASFMALGFSLIGIGWLYARQLRAPTGPVEPVVT